MSTIVNKETETVVHDAVECSSTDPPYKWKKECNGEDRFYWGECWEIYVIDE